MLLKTNYTKYIVLFFVSLFFVSCAKRTTYSHSTYQDTYQGSSSAKVYSYSTSTDVKNSKAMHRATMRPYTIDGIKYYPNMVSVGDRFKGIASWYGPNFHDKKTSNGETYDMYALTAAHKTLPMNTIVLVKNLENNKEVVVRINDRGPFVAKRIIDLSNKAAHKIDMVKKGTAKVEIKILGFYGKVGKSKRQVVVGEYMLQVGAFRIPDGARKTKKRYTKNLNKRYKVIIKKGWLKSKPIYRVFITGFRSENEAKTFSKNRKIYGTITAI